MTPEQLAARNARIREAWDDPLRRALQRAKKVAGGRRESREATLAYYRAYRARKRDTLASLVQDSRVFKDGED
jgi:hypothetical protein